MPTKAKFGIAIEKTVPKSWSFGICFSHMVDETYLFINFFKWSISIGKICKYNTDLSL